MSLKVVLETRKKNTSTVTPSAMLTYGGLWEQCFPTTLKLENLLETSAKYNFAFIFIIPRRTSIHGISSPQIWNQYWVTIDNRS